MASRMANAPPVLSTLSITEPDPELDAGPVPGGSISDEVSYLRLKEASRPDVLIQMQRQVSPDCVERTSFRTNTIPPRTDLDGVFYYPMGKLARDPAVSKKAGKSRMVRVTVPVGDERFQFILAVE
jgi:hypothetical protein